MTKDHSVFGMGKGASIEEVRLTELSEGDHIVTPRELPVPSERKKLDLLEKASELQGYFTGDMELEEYRGELKDQAGKKGYSRSAVQYWVREQILPAEILDSIDIEPEPGDLEYKHKRQSSTVPAEIELDSRMMEFLGLWMADGCYDNRSVLVTVSDGAAREVVSNVFERFDLPVKQHSDGHTLLANSQPLKEVMEKYGFEGDAHTKRIPEWLFSASDEQRHSFLRGLYSGDGYSTEHEVGIDLVNDDLVEDIQTMLLMDGIRGRAGDSGKMRSMRISDLEGLKEFKQKIGFLQDYKDDNLQLEQKESTHDTTDVVPIPLNIMEELCENQVSLQKNDYVTRGNNLGRQKLKQVASTAEGELLERLKGFSDSEIFWDQVRSVEKVREEGTVYD
ncbi:MAG: LAGLIDADG family homing endonuclease, partial [Candidatus Nanohaloarchaea archaeon]